MKRWYVVTPEYGSGGGYDEPPEYGCDVVEVDAPTKRAAITKGVKMMLEATYRNFKYCHDQRSDNASPFTGVRAEPYVNPDAEEQAFLDAIAASAGDDTPELAYSDWLEENGREVEAVAIRDRIQQVPT